MTRGTAALVVIMLAGCAQRGSPLAPALPMVKLDEALAEAARLDKAANELYDRGKYRDATPLAERSLALRERARGADHPDVAVGLNTRARVYQAQGALARAEPLFVRALAIRERALGATDPVVADSLNNLGSLYFAQGEYARAEPLLVRARDIRIQRLGATHPSIAESLNNLGSLYFAQGEYARAEPLLVQALAIREQALGAMHPDVAESVNNLPQDRRCARTALTEIAKPRSKASIRIADNRRISAALDASRRRNSWPAAAWTTWGGNLAVRDRGVAAAGRPPARPLRTADQGDYVRAGVA